MDTGARAWDMEVIPAERVERALERTREWLAPLGAHHATHGADPEVLPERDFEAGSWRCQSCPFLATCLPGDVEEGANATPESEEPEVSDEEAREAVTAYAAARETLREPEQAKRQALDTLKAWMRPQGSGKAELGNHTVSLVRSTRYAVDHKKLNALLDPEARAEIVTEPDLHVGPHQLSPDASSRKRPYGAVPPGAAPPSFRSGYGSSATPTNEANHHHKEEILKDVEND